MDTSFEQAWEGGWPRAILEEMELRGLPGRWIRMRARGNLCGIIEKPGID